MEPSQENPAVGRYVVQMVTYPDTGYHLSGHRILLRATFLNFNEIRCGNWCIRRVIAAGYKSLLVVSLLPFKYLPLGQRPTTEQLFSCTTYFSIHISLMQMLGKFTIFGHTIRLIYGKSLMSASVSAI
jgi:hypothetical protein